MPRTRKDRYTAWRVSGRTVGWIRNGVYYIDRALHGRRIRLSTTCVTKEAADAEYSRFELAPLAYVSPAGQRAFASTSTTLPPQAAAALRERNLLKYSITPAQVAELMRAQGGRCAICRRPAEETPRKVLDVDHCHRTGAVRGLLCGNCNRGLGQFLDDPALLERAATYLEARSAGAHSGLTAAPG